MSVERALVTGADEDQGYMFHLLVCPYANCIETRKLTSFYTIMSEDWSKFVAAAKLVNITTQQIDNRNRDEEIWNVVHQGTAQPWKTKSGKPAQVEKITVVVKRE